jgi:hypothetical protein
MTIDLEQYKKMDKEYVEKIVNPVTVANIDRDQAGNMIFARAWIGNHKIKSVKEIPIGEVPYETTSDKEHVEVIKGFILQVKSGSILLNMTSDKKEELGNTGFPFSSGDIMAVELDIHKIKIIAQQPNTVVVLQIIY